MCAGAPVQVIYSSDCDVSICSDDEEFYYYYYNSHRSDSMNESLLQHAAYEFGIYTIRTPMLNKVAKQPGHFENS